MPIMLPSAEEFRRIPHHKRLRIRRAVAKILAEVDDYAERVSMREQSAAEWGADVRERARDLERLTPWDDPSAIAMRRRILLGTTK